jgi:hypothetical protein
MLNKQSLDMALPDWLARDLGYRKKFCGAARSQLRRGSPFVREPNARGVIHMSASTDAKANFRMIVASFAAGVGAMMFVGLVAPTIVKGGLSLTTANASTLEVQAPAIAPLDVAAIRAQLAEAESDMQSARAATNANVARLERLAH